MEVLSRWGGWIYLKGSQYQRHNELVFKVLCYATTSVSQKLLDFFVQLTNTNKHSNTGLQWHFRVVKKNIVLRLNFVTNNFEQTVIQGVASDKVYCTHNNRQHIFKIFRACRLCLKMLALRTPCFGVWYPQGVRVPPVKNHCLCLTIIKLNCIAYCLRFLQSALIFMNFYVMIMLWVKFWNARFYTNLFQIFVNTKRAFKKTMHVLFWDVSDYS